MKHICPRNQMLVLYPDPHPPGCRHCARGSVYLGSFDYYLGMRLRRQQHGLCEVHGVRFAVRHQVPLPDAVGMRGAA